MKYFTKKIWLRLQNDKKSKYWESIWKKNEKLYIKHLKKIKTKLPNKTFQFFAGKHHHGDYILEIKLLNNGTTYYQKETHEFHLLSKKNNPLEITLTILCPSDGIYILRYKNIRKFIIDYPTEEPLDFESNNGIGCWGYDELSYSKGYFKHEILLHSGSIISLEFKTFNYMKKKPNQRRIS